MTPEQYIKEAGATDERDYTTIQERMSTEFNSKMIHYVLGLGTEVAELQDAMKKHLAYGRKLDIVNMKEEIGDMLWYTARIVKLLDTSFEEVMKTNNAKLKARFGDKFTEHAALNRDLEKEREILEK